MLQMQFNDGILTMSDESGLRFASCSGTQRKIPQYVDILNLPEHRLLFSTTFNEWRRNWITSDFKREEVIQVAVYA